MTASSERLLLVLTVVIFCAPVAQAFHLDGLDCDNLNCLICHANSDEESTSLVLSYKLYLPLADLSISPYKSIPKQATTRLVLIRAPPLRGRREYI